MTNAGRHAPGSQVRVTLDYQRDVLAVTVRNGRARRRPAAGVTRCPWPGSG